MSTWDAIIQWLTNVVNAIGAFLDYYFNETPLFEHTLDTSYDIFKYTTEQAIPLIGEYIEYITQYFS